MKAVKINTRNYFKIVDNIGFENLPLALQQSHTVIMTKTNKGKDWSKFKNDAELKQMLNLAFKKLGEFTRSLNGIESINSDIQSSNRALALSKSADILFSYLQNGYTYEHLLKANLSFNEKDITGKFQSGLMIITKLYGHKKNYRFLLHTIYELAARFHSLPNQGNNETKITFSDIGKEIAFIHRFLDFHDKILYKKTFEIFINDLQKAIKEKQIRKKSPVAKDIMAMQKAIVHAFNTMKNAKHFVLKPATIKRFKSIIEKYENAYDDLDEEYLQMKKDSIELSGVVNTAPVISNEIQEQQEEKESPANIMSSKDFTNLNFKTIGFKDKWLAFIGDPAPGFTAMVFGMPKMGKSYLCVDFAGYLARNHGKVLYVAKEEKLDKTLQDKLKDKDVAHENLDVADNLPDDLSTYQFVFLDSVNKLGLTPKDLEQLKNNNKGVSFIYIFQATKNGKFKGNNEFQHDVDIVIEVPQQGKAVQFGRFNQGGKLNIFSESSQEPGIENNTSMLSGLNKKEKGKKSNRKVIRKKYRKFLSSSKGKVIIKRTELGIPLEELAIEMLPEDADKTEIVEVIYSQTKRVEETAKILAEQALIDEGLKVKVKSLKYKENDSDNITHGVSYFDVVLEGAKEEIKKIAGEDKLFYCEW